MRFRELRAAIAVSVMVFAAAAVRAQVSGKIEGTVVDEAGKEVAGVKVEASEPASGTRSTSTDKAGRYRFLGLRPGGYKVTFTLDSYAEVQKNGTVRLDGTVTINAKMFRTAD
jgi:hypothetical protein